MNEVGIQGEARGTSLSTLAWCSSCSAFPCDGLEAVHQVGPQWYKVMSAASVWNHWRFLSSWQMPVSGYTKRFTDDTLDRKSLASPYTPRTSFEPGSQCSPKCDPHVFMWQWNLRRECIWMTDREESRHFNNRRSTQNPFLAQPKQRNWNYIT